MAISTTTTGTTIKAKIIALAQSQIGYKETGTNHTKYAQYFDTPKSKGGPYPWFNGKKQGAAWCAIFVCWLFVMVLRDNLGWTTDAIRVWLGCPKNPADNCAAGCPWFFKYLKAKGWQVDKKSGQPGDIIFFNSSCSHVGIIEKVDASKYYTIEGNKSNQVKRCSYSRGNSVIYGLMRPNYASLEEQHKPDPEPTPVPTPTPAPTPTPTPKPTSKKYKVTAKHGLNVRRGPGLGYKVVKTLSYGTVVTVYEKKNGWGRIGTAQWCSMTYLKAV